MCDNGDSNSSKHNQKKYVKLKTQYACSGREIDENSERTHQVRKLIKNAKLRENKPKDTDAKQRKKFKSIFLCSFFSRASKSMAKRKYFSSNCQFSHARDLVVRGICVRNVILIVSIDLPIKNRI